MYVSLNVLLYRNFTVLHIELASAQLEKSSAKEISVKEQTTSGAPKKHYLIPNRSQIN